MMPPPDQRTERERVRAGKVFGTIKILIWKIFQMLAFYQLMEGGIEIGRDDERQTCQLIPQYAMRRLKHGSYFSRDRSLFPKELCVGQQRRVIVGEQHRLGSYGTRLVHEDDEKARSARPQRANGRGVRGWYVEAFSDARRRWKAFATSSRYLWRVSNAETVSSYCRRQSAQRNRTRS